MGYSPRTNPHRVIVWSGFQTHGGIVLLEAAQVTGEWLEEQIYPMENNGRVIGFTCFSFYKRKSMRPRYFKRK